MATWTPFVLVLTLGMMARLAFAAPTSLLGVFGSVQPACAGGAFQGTLKDGLFMYLPLDSYDPGSSDTNMTSQADVPIVFDNVYNSSWTRNIVDANPTTEPGLVGNGTQFHGFIDTATYTSTTRNYLKTRVTTDWDFGDMKTLTNGAVPAFTVAFWLRVNSFASDYGSGYSATNIDNRPRPGFPVFGWRPFETTTNRWRFQDTTGFDISVSAIGPYGPFTITVTASSADAGTITPLVSTSTFDVGVWTHVAVRIFNDRPPSLWINGTNRTPGGFSYMPCRANRATCSLLPPKAPAPSSPPSPAPVASLLFLNAWLTASNVLDGGSPEFRRGATRPQYGADMAPAPVPPPGSDPAPLQFAVVPGPPASPILYTPTGVRYNEGVFGFDNLNWNVTYDEMALWTRNLTDAEVVTLFNYGVQGRALSSEPLSSCACSPGFFSTGRYACTACDSKCATCSGTPDNCVTCASAGVSAPSCAASACAAQCATCASFSDPTNCVTCSAGFESPPLCRVTCAPQCLACEGTGTNCTACATGRANRLPDCPDPSALVGKKSSGSNTPVLAGAGAGVGLACLVAIIVVIVVIKKRKGGEKPLDYAVLMGKPVSDDAWERLFPDWMSPRYTLASAKSYPVMEEFVAANPLEARLLAGLAETAPKRALSDLVVATMAYTESRDGASMALIKQLVDMEVAATLSPETLFRQNSAATKFFQSFAKLRAVEYVRKTIGPLVHDTLHQFHKSAAGAAKAKPAKDDEGGGVYMSTKTDGLEVDPTRLDEDASLDVNRYKLMTVCAAFLDSMFRSAPSCPQALKEVLAYVGTSVNRAFPGREVQGMGGFFFLRLFCPAITSPAEYLITQSEAGEDERRYLVLVAKVLQNAANGVKFGKKEAHMVELNDFIESYIPKIQRFFAEQLFAGANPALGTFPGPNNPPPTVPQQIRANSLAMVHENIRESAAPLAQWLTTHQAAPAQQQLDAIMSLPPPPAAVAVSR